MYLSPNWLYTVFSFAGFVMCAIPFYWHLDALNVGTCLYMAWAGLGCLMQCINSIVWNNNVIDKAPIYCDISVRLQIGIAVAIPACSFCITRRLYKIVTANVTMITGAEKRRAIIVDLLIGFGIPFLQMIVEYVVSGHRYNIFEDVGPFPALVNMPPTYLLVWAWPAAIGVISLVYGVRTIVTFYNCERRLRETSSLSSSYALNRSRYLRLMVLASMDIVLTVPFAIYGIVANAERGVKPWISWDDTHRHYSRVIQVPRSIWGNDYRSAQALEIFRWTLVLAAFLFFAFFGLAEEAHQHYRLAYRWIACRIGCKTSSWPFNKPSHVTPSPPKMKNYTGGVIATPRHRCNSSISLSSIETTPTTILDSKIGQIPPSDTIMLSSLSRMEPEPQGETPQPAATLAAIPPVYHRDAADTV